MINTIANVDLILIDYPYILGILCAEKQACLVYIHQSQDVCCRSNLDKDSV